MIAWWMFLLCREPQKDYLLVTMQTNFYQIPTRFPFNKYHIEHIFLSKMYWFEYFRPKKNNNSTTFCFPQDLTGFISLSLSCSLLT